MHTDTASETIVISTLMLIAELGWAEGTGQHRTPPPESAGCTSPRLRSRYRVPGQFSTSTPTFDTYV